MEKKAITIISIIFAVLLCGLPGLAGLCLGSMALLGGLLPGSDIPQEEITLVVGGSIMILGASLLLIATPIAIGLWIWWSQKKETATMEALVLPEEDF